MNEYINQLHECISLPSEIKKVLDYFVEHADANRDFPVGEDILGQYVYYDENGMTSTENAQAALLEICVCKPMLRMLELMLPRKFPPYLTRTWSGSVKNWFEFPPEQKESMSKKSEAILRVNMIIDHLLPRPDGTFQTTRSEEELECIVRILGNIRLIDNKLYESIVSWKLRFEYAHLLPCEVVEGSKYSVSDLESIAYLLQKNRLCTKADGFSSCFTDQGEATFKFCKPMTWGAISYIVKKIYSDNKDEGEAQNVPNGVWEKFCGSFSIGDKQPSPTTLRTSKLSNKRLRDQIDQIFDSVSNRWK